MRLDELEALCRQAASDLLTREGRPLPPAVVLPTAQATRVLTVPDLPADPAARRQALAALAEREMRPQGVPCWGFVGEAVAAGEAVDADVCLVAYGARGHPPQVTAAPFADEGLGAFVAPEPLDERALPELSVLQRAAEQAAAPPTGGSGPEPGPLDLWRSSGSGESG